MSVPGDRPRRVADVDHRRAEILDATVAVARQKGFAATRVADVAGYLGISTGLVHYHFSSKDALLAAAFEHAGSAELDRVTELVDGPGSALQRLGALLRHSLPRRREEGWLLWIDAWGEAIRSPALAETSAALDRRLVEALERVLADGVASGELRCSSPRGAAWRLSALIDGLSVQVAIHDGMLEPAEVEAWVFTAGATEAGVDVGTLRRAAGLRAQA